MIIFKVALGPSRTRNLQQHLAYEFLCLISLAYCSPHVQMNTAKSLQNMLVEGILVIWGGGLGGSASLIKVKKDSFLRGLRCKMYNKIQSS